MRGAPLICALLLCFAASGILAHGTETHAAPDLPEQSAAVTPLPWDIGGPFALVDHTGAARTEAEPDGKMQLVFFGYANCPGICSAALPMMADVSEILAARDIAVSPVLITIDPSLDTVATMGPALVEISQGFIGLTGTPEALGVAYKAFQISFTKIMDDPELGPIYAHGSHIYLLDGAGKVLTLLPPVLSPDQAAEIIANYAGM
ncbi:protein SCO1/2 [Roseovarius marisflavi]|uniref:Protein SCO1/2 n=1 Tax=Roseovarius marisflavi TaxID=1054996 RepID=A0A1M6Z9R6_9RHOB|nr:SCO family protein [Roseovarius marisflavi]SHL27246.1 protein SCO1/2 [Roseovarius marisflavi]